MVLQGGSARSVPVCGTHGSSGVLWAALFVRGQLRCVCTSVAIQHSRISHGTVTKVGGSFEIQA